MRLATLLLVTLLAGITYGLDLTPSRPTEAWSDLFRVASTCGVAANADETPRHLGQEAEIARAWRGHRESTIHYQLGDPLEGDPGCDRALACQDPVPAPPCPRPNTYVPPPCSGPPLTMLCVPDGPCTTPCSDTCTYDCTFICSVPCSVWCTSDCTFQCSYSCTYWCTGSCTIECTGWCTTECTYYCTDWCTTECTYPCTDICTNHCTYDCTGACTFPCTNPQTSYGGIAGSPERTAAVDRP